METTKQELWDEFMELWRQNWYDGYSVFDKEKLSKLLKKHGVEFDATKE